MKREDIPIADEDAALVAATRNGDLAAFETLVKRHQQRMLNVAFRITGCYEDACEVVQDAFVAAYRGLDGFRGAARFTTWLTSITANLSRNRREQLQTRRRNEPFSLNDPLPGGDGDLIPDPPAPGPSPHEQLEEEALRKQLERCIGELPPEFREVLVLRDMEEFAYEEIGTILGLQAGTVKSRLFRGRESVRDCLKKVFASW
jgi:RNA polymerase sigma-70 factor (ECF subfamily)